MREKRGQITLFIIIGILIVALAGVFIYIRSEKITIEEPEVIPAELFPVKEYVESCEKITLTKAVLLMGQQGGYLYVPESIRYDPTSFIAPTERSEIIVPYWYHDGKTIAPTIKGMEEQISRYVNEHIGDCLRNFTAMKEQFDIRETGNITSKTTIGVNEVIITTKYPLNVGVRGTKELTRIATFSTSIPIKLRKMYELAADIMEAENNQLFLEDLTINLMTLGPEIPFSDVVFQCGQLRWFKPDVEEAIKNILYYNFPKIRFKGTNHEPFLELEEKYENLRQYTPEDIGAGKLPKAQDVPADAYDYFHFYWDAATEDYKDLRAAVLFQKEWNFDMEVKPSQGDIMSASYGKGFEKYLSFLCINMFHFTYDLDYPVQIVISDDSAFDGQGYRFKFAFPVIISSNQGNRESVGVTRMDVPEGSDGGYCDEKTKETYDIRAKDSTTFTDISGANATFNCMNTYYCNVGQTDADGGIYRVRSQLPSFCRPGAIDMKHEDYLDTSQDIEPGKFDVFVFMTPLKTLDFEAKKYRITAGMLMPQEPLEEGQYAVIYLRSDNFTGYDIYRRYPAEADSPEEFNTIKLPKVDATYDLDVILMSREDEPIGGYRSKVLIKGSDVSSASRIVFNSIEKIPHPETDDQKAGMLIDIGSSNYTNLVKVELGP
ncbi:hypothetical protein COV19_07370 [Candidatus Woesearchaeota archaeon CG10_big_fil_rev_8_21_14_0_10_44_13]|nr:MAG: hypothetical protein COV19_07370 [Candidatus Woesearchaeota archaeon CG10_big_fil_rev_8_21_14_0_10_44_13]